FIIHCIHSSVFAPLVKSMLSVDYNGKKLSPTDFAISNPDINAPWRPCKKCARVETGKTCGVRNWFTLSLKKSCKSYKISSQFLNDIQEDFGAICVGYGNEAGTDRPSSCAYVGL